VYIAWQKTTRKLFRKCYANVCVRGNHLQASALHHEVTRVQCASLLRVYSALINSESAAGLMIRQYYTRVTIVLARYKAQSAVNSISSFKRHLYYQAASPARRRGLLLQTSHVAWSVCLCILGTRVSCAKTGEPIDVPFWGLTHVDPRNRALHGGQDPTNPFAAARGDKSVTRPFAKWRWTLVVRAAPRLNFNSRFTQRRRL